MTPRAPSTLYFESPAGQLYYHPAGFVRLAWAAGRLPLETIQAYYEQVLDLLLSTGCQRILSEHGQRAPLPVEAQRWITADWIPRAIARSQTRHCAIVEGANPLHRLSTQSVVSAAPAEFQFKRFDTVQEAESWLLTVVL
jgi:hypothetical protein